MKSTERRTLRNSVILAALIAVMNLGAGAEQQAPSPGTEPSDTPSIDLSPDKLDFGQQAVGTVSVVKSINVTAVAPAGAAAAPPAATPASPPPSVKISATTTGDFGVDAGACQGQLAAGDRCVLTVTFSPKQLGPTTASLVVTTDPASTARIVSLSGEGVGCCAVGPGLFTGDWFKSITPVLVVVFLYLLGLILVRWNMIALPTRKLLMTQIESVRARAATLDPAKPGVAQINDLLNKAMGPFTKQSAGERAWRASTPMDWLFWTRGQELAGWAFVHEAEERMVTFLEPEGIRAAMEVAEAGLREAGTSTAQALAARIQDALAATPSADIERCKALLSEALGMLYDRTDTKFATLVSWHNKTVWLTCCGLLFIVALAATLQHGILLLVGATGGLLSRLSRSLQRADVPTDYGASWTTLFLSPVVGALAGWSGILLVVLAVKLQVLGATFDLNWCNPCSPLALGLAFLLGFSERAFDGILTQLEQKVQAQSPSSPEQPLNIGTAGKLPNGKVDQDYTQPLVASGGTPPYKWSTTNGTPPPGLSLDPSGRITGKPNAAGGSSFTLTVTDSASKTKSQDFTLTIDA
jgi:hypothetical protein